MWNDGNKFEEEQIEKMKAFAADIMKQINTFARDAHRNNQRKQIEDICIIVNNIFVATLFPLCVTEKDPVAALETLLNSLTEFNIDRLRGLDINEIKETLHGTVK